MSYTTVSGKNGVRYLKDKKFVKKADIPKDILIKLDVGMKEVAPEPTEPEITKCVFCGQVTKQFRLLNQKAIAVCANDYYDKTLGQLAQQVRIKETPS